MKSLLTFFSTFVFAHQKIVEIDAGNLVIARGRDVNLFTTGLADEFKNADSAYIECFIKASSIALTFSPNVKCGTSLAFSPGELPAFFSALSVRLQSAPVSSQPLALEIFFYKRGRQQGVYKLALQPLTEPAHQLLLPGQLKPGEETLVLQLGSQWSGVLTPQVLLSGSAASKVAIESRRGAFYATLKPGSRIASTDSLAITLVDNATNLRSQTFHVIVPPFPWGKTLILAFFGVLTLVLVIAGVFVLKEPKKAIEAKQSIDDWNNSFVARSLTTVKTEDDSFSTVISQFEDAQLSRKDSPGILLSPSVEVLDLPFDVRVSL